MFEDDHRAIVPDSGNRQTLRVIGRGRHDHFEAGDVGQDSVEGLGMLRARASAVSPVVTAARAVSRAYHQRQFHLAAHHVMHLGGLIHDLVIAAADEVHEHDLDNRPQAGHRGANASAEKTHFRNRRVEDAFGAKFGNQAASCAKRSAPGVHETEMRAPCGTGDVFAHNNNLGIAAHFLANGFIDGLTETEFSRGGRGHFCSPSRAGT